MPPQRKSEPLSEDRAALARAIEMVIAQDPEMTQETVAADGELNIKQVNEFVRGQGNPTYLTLLKLCRGLHIELARLMTLAEELRDKR